MRWRVRIPLLVLGLLLLGQLVARAELSLTRKSPVWDEQLHLRYGLDLLARGPTDHGRDHPYPVAALLALPTWLAPGGPASGRELVVERPEELWPARHANVALAALGLLLLSGLLWLRLGPAYGLGFLAMGSLDPGWIAQARFVTTDVTLGLAFGLAALCLAWVRSSGRPVAVVVLGLVVCLGLTAKLSALMIPALLPLTFLVPLPGEPFREGLWSRLLRGLTWGALAAALGVALYLGILESFALAHGQGPGQGLRHAMDGLLQSVARQGAPRGVFLLGTFYPHGTFLYFPVLLLAKTPLALWALLAAAATTSAGRAFAARHRLLWIAPGAFLLVAIGSRVNLGHRHLLPVLPGLWLLAVAGGVALWRQFRLGPLYVSFLGLALAIECLSAHPNYLPFTNVLFGGQDGAHRVAVDSASDWGQDLPALRSYLQRHPPLRGPVHLAYFGNADPRAFLGEVVWRPCGRVGAPLRRGQPAAGCSAPAEVLAISASCYQGVTGKRVKGRWRLDLQSSCWRWLHGQRPEAIVGGSILVFRSPRR